MDKVQFNLVFNSSNINSFTGTIQNPTFFTSFNTLIPSDKYNKFYKVTFRFSTASDPIIDDQENYRLEMFLNSRIYNQQNNANDYTLGTLSKKLENFTNNELSFDTTPYHNPPIVINSLDRIDKITFKIIQESDGTLFENMIDYILILHFEEL